VDGTGQGTARVGRGQGMAGLARAAGARCRAGRGRGRAGRDHLSAVGVEPGWLVHVVRGERGARAQLGWESGVE
jgi:hypothetical protein